jgi:hypothetical protein
MGNLDGGLMVKIQPFLGHALQMPTRGAEKSTE